MAMVVTAMGMAMAMAMVAMRTEEMVMLVMVMPMVVVVVMIGMIVMVVMVMVMLRPSWAYLGPGSSTGAALETLLGLPGARIIERCGSRGSPGAPWGSDPRQGWLRRPCETP